MPRRPRQARSTSSAPITSCRWPVAIAAPAPGRPAPHRQRPRLHRRSAWPARRARSGTPGRARPLLHRLRRHALGHPDGIDRGPSNGQADRVPWKALRAMSGTRECRPVVRFAAERRQDDAHQYPLPCARMPAPHGVTEVSATAPAYLDSICQGAAALVLMNSPGCTPSRSSQQITALADKPSHADVQALSSPSTGPGERE